MELYPYTLINARNNNASSSNSQAVTSNDYEGEIGDYPKCGCILIWIHGYNVDLKKSKDSFNKVAKLYKDNGGKCDVALGENGPEDPHPHIAENVSVHDHTEYFLHNHSAVYVDDEKKMVKWSK